MTDGSTAKKKNLHAGHRERMRQRCLEEGLDGFEDHQVLELVLFFAVPYRDTNELAHSLIERFGSFSSVLNADFSELMQVPGVGKNTATLLTILPDVFRRYQLDAFGAKPALDSVAKVGEYCCSLFLNRNYEAFYLICLNRQLRLNRAVLVAEGSLGEVTVSPRLVVEAAMCHHADTVILAHNHPGGSLQPSREDLEVTNLIKEALVPLGVEVLDHIIVGRGNYVSMGKKGLIKGLLP